MCACDYWCTTSSPLRPTGSRPPAACATLKKSPPPPSHPHPHLLHSRPSQVATAAWNAAHDPSDVGLEEGDDEFGFYCELAAQ